MLSGRALQAIALGIALGLAAGFPCQAGAQGRSLPKPSTPDRPIPKRPLADLLRIGSPDLSIGSEDDEGPYMFGRVGGITATANGTIYVSDWAENNIRSFDSRGRHIATFGRRGCGPGEFVNPLTLFHDGDSTLFASEMNFGITEITAIRGVMHHRRTFGVGLRARSMCKMRDTLLVVSWKNDKLLHMLGSDGEVARSFGAAWSPDTTPVIREQLNSPPRPAPS